MFNRTSLGRAKPVLHGVASLLLGTIATVSHAVSVAPTASYLQADASDQPTVFFLDLAANGLGAGDLILLASHGDFSFHGPSGPEDGSGMTAVFSASSTVLPPTSANRVVDAIDAGDDFLTPPTFGGIPTDIPEDFWISPEGTEIEVPCGAKYLFVGAYDEFWGDNSDPDGDWGFTATVVTEGPNDPTARLENVDASHTSYLRVPDSPELEPQQFTMEAWIQPEGVGYGATTTGNGAAILAKPSEGAQGTYILSWQLSWHPTTEKVYLALTHTYNGAGVNVASVRTIAQGSIAHVAATFDGAVIRLYVNGCPDASAAWPYQGVYYGNQDVLIGAGNYSAPFYRRFAGKINEVCIWGYARSTEQVADDHACGIRDNDPGLLAFWRFNNSLEDVTGHGHNAVAQGVSGSFSYSVMPLPSCRFALSGVGDNAPNQSQESRISFTGPNPNPVSAATTFQLHLRAATEVRVTVHDVAGRQIRVLADAALGAGVHELIWDGRDESRARVPSGIYFVIARSAAGSRIQRVTRVQ